MSHATQSITLPYFIDEVNSYSLLTDYKKLLAEFKRKINPDTFWHIAVLKDIMDISYIIQTGFRVVKVDFKFTVHNNHYNKACPRTRNYVLFNDIEEANLFKLTFGEEAEWVLGFNKKDRRELRQKFWSSAYELY